MQSKPEKPIDGMSDSVFPPDGVPQDMQADDAALLEDLSESAAASEDMAPGSWLDVLSDDEPVSDESPVPEGAPASEGPSASEGEAPASVDTLAVEADEGSLPEDAPEALPEDASEALPDEALRDSWPDELPENMTAPETVPQDAPAPENAAALEDAVTPEAVPQDAPSSDAVQDAPANVQLESASQGPEPPDRGPAKEVPSATDEPSMKDELRSVSPVASFRVLRDAFRQWRKEHGIFLRVLFNIVRSLIVVAAAAVLIVTLVLPILRISGDSMTDTLEDRDVVVALRGSDCETGDVIAFYYNNKILVKRVIASSGQWVDIDRQGNVFVDGVRLDEPYVTDKSLGECNIKLPYQVPEDRLFVMGDHRSTSIDSRNTAVGCVSDEQIVGRLVLCAWPLTRFGGVG